MHDPPTQGTIHNGWCPSSHTTPAPETAIHPYQRYRPALSAGGATAIAQGPRLEPHLPAEESPFFIVDLPILRRCLVF
jgi:hypothetical protein